MNRSNDIRSLLEAWFKQRGRMPQWSRPINPSGEQLHLEPPGMSVLVLDLAIEDNKPEAILDALAQVCEGRLAENIKVTIKADLSVVVR